MIKIAAVFFAQLVVAAMSYICETGFKSGEEVVLFL